MDLPCTKADPAVLYTVVSAVVSEHKYTEGLQRVGSFCCCFHYSKKHWCIWVFVPGIMSNASETLCVSAGYTISWSSITINDPGLYSFPLGCVVRYHRQHMILQSYLFLLSFMLILEILVPPQIVICTETVCL